MLVNTLLSIQGTSEGSRMGSPTVIRSVSAEFDDAVSLTVQLQSDYQYILAEDEELNETTREEFYYDQVLTTQYILWTNYTDVYHCNMILKSFNWRALVQIWVSILPFRLAHIKLVFSFLFRLQAHRSVCQYLICIPNPEIVAN